MNLFAKIRAFFDDRDGNFEDGGELNEHSTNRNKNVTIISCAVLALAAFGLWKYIQPAMPTSVSDDPEVETNFGQIVDKTFTDKDNQSALTEQQLEISELQKQNAKQQKEIEKLRKEADNNIKEAKERVKDEMQSMFNRELNKAVSSLENQIETLKNDNQNYRSSSQQPVNQPSKFGETQLPPPAYASSNDNPDIDNFQYGQSQNVSFNTSFDSSDFFWEEEEPRRTRTTENYVPSGTFVTAQITGGADANAGVMGQGDTTPIILQTINDGILPNGKKSKLNNCTITAATYGEISSSRGIVRTNRMSCILPNDEILDIPVKGTVFNFGRNGIRGTTILKNGKVVQMAGVAGILTGLGEFGKGLSETTSSSALGSTTSVTGDQVGLNLLGNATTSVGSKLADYYIGLAEMYHPIVEINPGGIVNVVFQTGFPLDPVEAEQYEQQQRLDENISQSNHVMEVISNVATNPLATTLSKEGIEIPPSPFSSK